MKPTKNTTYVKPTKNSTEARMSKPGLTHQQVLDVRELIQDDLLTYLDGMSNRILTEVCEIVVKRFQEQLDKADPEKACQPPEKMA